MPLLSGRCCFWVLERPFLSAKTSTEHRRLSSAQLRRHWRSYWPASGLQRWEIEAVMYECSEYLSAHSRWAAPPARLLHRLPSLNGVVPQHPPPSHRLRVAGRNVAVGPDGYPLRVDRRRVGLEVTELLLLLGIHPPIIAQLLTHCCHQWKAVYKMESGGTVAT